MNVTIYGETGIVSYGTGVLNGHTLETTTILAFSQIIVLNGKRYRITKVELGNLNCYTISDVRGLF